MKKTVVFIVFSLFLSVITFIPSDRATAASSEKDVEKQLEETVEDQLEGIDWESLQNFIDEECDDVGILGKSLSETTEDILSGNFSTISCRRFFRQNKKHFTGFVGNSGYLYFIRRRKQNKIQSFGRNDGKFNQFFLFFNGSSFYFIGYLESVDCCAKNNILDKKTIGYSNACFTYADDCYGG